MEARVIDFLYDNREMLTNLVEILKKGRDFQNLNPTSLRVYQLVIAVDQLKSACEIKQPMLSLEYKRTIASLRSETVRLMPKENLVFFEHVGKSDTLYFYYYLKNEIADDELKSELYTFARAASRAAQAAS